MSEQELVSVDIGACTCPGTPHEHDVVSLRPILDLRGGFRIKRRLIDLNKAAYGEEEVDLADLEGALAEAYLLEGVYSWNLVDEEGAALPVSEATIRERLFADYGRGEAVADKADDLYRPEIIDPLARRALSSSPDTQTSESTSPTNGVGHKRRTKQSKRSSTSTIPMDSTEVTTVAPVGDSNS